MISGARKDDLSMRIVEAMTRITEPGENYCRQMRKGDKVIGVVPLHLRHFYNLINEFHSEVSETISLHADKEFADDMNDILGSLFNIFSISLDKYLSLSDEQIRPEITDTWEVVVNPTSAEPEEDKSVVVVMCQSSQSRN